MTLTLVDEFDHYSDWRDTVRAEVERLRTWLDDEALDDGQSAPNLAQLVERLQEDTLKVAFVAEFSRGKSELINAIFFSDYRQRVLPSSAGRTTMCPTELYHSASARPALRLLPIHTRTREGSIADLKREPSLWTEFPLNLDSAEEMSATLMHLADTIEVDAATADSYGLLDPADEDVMRSLAAHGGISIPRWRHALINFPHPLLKQGLVILDTPGLNAIGTEPELTLNMLPSAHAVLFLLAADTGVTKSDIEIWRQHIAPVQAGSRARLVVLNKIDGLWDELKSADAIDAEIARQVVDSAALLGLSAGQVYPVSAQKALVAKVRDDDALLAKSRLPDLEAALTRELIPSKQALVSESARAAVEDVVVKTTELLETRLANIQDQVDELRALRGKNQGAVRGMMVRANEDKKRFDRGLLQFKALRHVYSAKVELLRQHLGKQRLRMEVRRTRDAMEQSNFTSDLREAMKAFFHRVDGNLRDSTMIVLEIHAMMTGMYRKFSEEYGLAAVSPPVHNLHKYRKELARLEALFEERFTAFHMLTTAQDRLTARFFDSLVREVVTVFELANSATEAWLKGLIAPMETQVREHKAQLKRRLESVSRIHAATQTLDERIAELEAGIEAVGGQLDALARLNATISEALQAAPKKNVRRLKTA